MLAGQIYHIVISLCDVNDLDQSPVLRFGPKLIRNRACSDVSQCPRTLYVPRRSTVGVVVFIDLFIRSCSPGMMSFIASSCHHSYW
jgi:hypothetical protein